MDYDKFKNYITDHLTLTVPLKTTIDIDQAIHTLTVVIHQAIQHFTTPRQTQQRESLALQLKVRNLLAQKRRARAKRQTFRYPFNR
jgi:hypothetical protein